MDKNLEFKPARMLEVELGRPLSDVSAVDAVTSQKYQRAFSLVRLHSHPLGVVELQLGDNGLDAEDYARAIWQTLSEAINEHLKQDGWPLVVTLEADGLSGIGAPHCTQERARLLASAPFVSIVIATHDRTESLSSCLKSLLSLEYPSFEIIVVDNAPSSNATADFIQQTYGDHAHIRYVREEQPGLAVAHNRGLLEVNAPFVAFTDDDVAVDRHWLTELVLGFSAAPNVACVTGMIYPAEIETAPQEWIEQYWGLGKGYARRIFDRSVNRPKSFLYPYTAGSFGSGANMAFKTSVLRELGGFDPALGAGSVALGGDDLAAFFQIVDNGYGLVYEPAAIVHHWHRREYAGLRRQAYGYGVSLTAYLTKLLVDKPSRIFDFAIRMPAGLIYGLSSRSPKNNRKQANYPKELTRIERSGMLHGPWAYVRSRRLSRRLRNRSDSLHSPNKTSALATSLSDRIS